MKIPKFWRRHEGDITRPDGRELRLFAWGWSETSTGEAEAKAQERFRSLEQRVSQGLDLPRGYAYGDRPVREQIIGEIFGRDGHPDGLLTRNTYGSVVLNASRSMFIDIDGENRGGAQLDRVRAAMKRSSVTSARVYKTAAGFRLLATDRPYSPGSSESEALMKQVGADPAFIQLCRIQDSFRARLSPKPWRVGRRPPPGDFPREDKGLQTAFDEWLTDYDRASAGHATCQFLETIGTDVVHPDLDHIVSLHDEQTGAGSNLPLA